ncbi:unnamed protein product [Penicillium salamii]|uniref:Killer toxin Kp4 domain-containing protein n=1 Tax=Penicillium salamii TaxID=1612424 RepID=A0A9W4IEG3_9EURO|nr:unnamed protein product [Penicillium salamii]CAG7964783.1 unnamed protein product [Penicillium salamii]CAG8019856.1 unnamed protein product [Penicillium salamii]CAG8087738.1 unnamed protein product [Penicillium salamii]CAG8161736.1 unnamed protein product [Penicillium salamii]
MKFTAVLSLLLPAVAVNAALGINCRGSAKCSGLWGPDNVANNLKKSIDGIDTNRWYYNGEHIACVSNQAGNGGGYCAFLQGTGGTNGGKIKELAHYIPDHGFVPQYDTVWTLLTLIRCKMCGSVPYFYPGDNNVEHGQLTFNYVDNPCNTAGTTLC